MTQHYLKPQSSRNRLVANSLRISGVNYTLTLPPYYKALFLQQEKSVVDKCGIVFGYEVGSYWPVARFQCTDEKCASRIVSFVKDYTRYIVIGLNKNISSFFSDEINSCLALDFTFDFEKNEKTDIDKVYNQAKYSQDLHSARLLYREMQNAIFRVPFVFKGNPLYLSYVPCVAGRSFYLPRLLARNLVAFLKARGIEVYLLAATLTRRKGECKNLGIDSRISLWNDLYDLDAVALDKDVQGCDVLVIDDSYQSGISMWSFASYLKSRGALSVSGLVCVKTMRDTDNT